MAYKHYKPVLRNASELNNVRENHLYEKELEQARKEGLPTSLADLNPTNPPLDNMNSAPIYQELRTLKADYDENDIEVRFNEQLNRSDFKAVQLFIKKHEHIYSLVHQAVNRPEFFVSHDTKADPSGIEFPEFGDFRRICRLLRLESMIMVHGNNGVAAVQNMGLGFQAANHAVKEPILIGWHVSVACNAIVFNSMQDILTKTHGDPATANAVKQAIKTRYQQHSLSDVIKSEMAFQCSELAYIKKHYKVDNLSWISGTNVSFKDIDKHRWTDLVDLNGIMLIRHLRKNINAADLPYPQTYADIKKADDKFVKLKGQKVVIATILYPVISKTTDIWARETSAKEVTLSAVDLFIYKSKHGSFPERLEQAIPNPPIDPFDLKPLRYRREGKGFVVYSIGETLKYDGQPIVANKSDDIVFRYSEKNGEVWK